MAEMVKPTSDENESKSLLNKSDKSSKKWTTFQCCWIILVLIIVTNLATNMDRIVSSFQSDSDTNNNSEFTDEPLSHPSFCQTNYRDNTWLSTGHGDRNVGQNFASRSPSVSYNGMIAGSQPLITQAGLNILKLGGNAVDAAIAANAMAGLVEPTGNGIGGDIMLLIHNPEDNKLYGYNGSGKSAKNFSFDDMNTTAYDINGNGFVPYNGPYPITVPGAVKGWCDIHERFGRMEWKDLFNDTINKARNGFVITQVIGRGFRNAYNSYTSPNRRREITSNDQYPNALDGWINTYTLDGENTPEFGEVFINEGLANSIEAIANGGCDAFYNGELTERMVDTLNSVGSPLTVADFNEHNGEFVDPINTTYRDDYLVSQLGGNVQGIAVLQMLNMMELYNFSSMDIRSKEYIHLNVEIKKLVFADRAIYYGDDNNDDVCVPINELLSKEYAYERSKLIDPNRAATSVDPGDLNCEEVRFPYHIQNSDTIYLTTADNEGMMVSLIQSNYAGFGSGIANETLGFTFQNRGAGFNLIPNSVNQYKPGKRPFHTIIPGFMHIKDPNNANNWLPYYSFGVMGGAVQPQGHAQVISGIVDYGLTVQETGDIARWTHSGSTQPDGEIMNQLGGRVTIESGICQSIGNELINMGHVVSYSPNSGGYQGILRDINNHVYYGGTELRKDGIALGY